MIQATNKNYVVEPLGKSKETSGGIIIQHSDESELGEIVSVGSDIENPIAVGSKVVVNWGAAIPVVVNTKRVLIVNKDHILGIVNDD